MYIHVITYTKSQESLPLLYLSPSLSPSPSFPFPSPSLCPSPFPSPALSLSLFVSPLHSVVDSALPESPPPHSLSLQFHCVYNYNCCRTNHFSCKFIYLADGVRNSLTRSSSWDSSSASASPLTLHTCIVVQGIVYSNMHNKSSLA